MQQVCRPQELSSVLGHCVINAETHCNASLQPGDSPMTYRRGNRHQIQLFPDSLDDSIAKDGPVRAYDAFVDLLNLPDLKFEIDAHKAGNPEYHPAPC